MRFHGEKKTQACSEEKQNKRRKRPTHFGMIENLCQKNVKKTVIWKHTC